MRWEVTKEILSSRWVKELWGAFEIQVLVIASLLFQTVTAVFGSRRKYKIGVYTRFFVWFSYLMGNYVAMVAIGKLTETNNDSFAITSFSYGDHPPKVNVTSKELRAIWAPLLLVHIGGPDGITAYAVEDNRLGVRQFLEMGVQIIVVGLIFIKSWNNSWLSIISLTLLLSGAIKSFERVWALRCSVSTDPVFADLCRSKTLDIDRVRNIKSSVPEILLLVKAYIRFEHLKPHVQNWIGHPLSINIPSLSIYPSPPLDAFTIAEIELSYMYDVLYTRAPVNYSCWSFIRRTICFLCLVSSLCGFAILFRHVEVHLLKILVSRKYEKKVDISITYMLLVGAITLELYALLHIVSSDWSVLYLIKEKRSKFTDAFLHFFAQIIPRSPRWSNHMQQLNLIDFCQHKEQSRTKKFINFILKNIRISAEMYNMRVDQSYKKFCLTCPFPVDDVMKEFIIEQVEKVREQRVWQAFTNRGQWALERNKCLDQFKWSLESNHTSKANQQTSFGRAITVWHIATDFCYRKEIENGNSKKKNKFDIPELSKRLSEYMMYLLAVCPHMLSIGTGDVIFNGACEKVREFLQNLGSTSDCLNSWLRDQTFAEETTINMPPDRFELGSITSDVIVSSWDLIIDAKLLHELLINRDDIWILLSSVWTEMLFYAASNCLWNHHTEQLRLGGGLITIAWLLLNHEANQFNICMY